MQFGNKTYNFLKQMALIWIPALATLYAGLAALWNLGDVSQIVGTFSGVDTFLGVVLHISSKTYNAPPADGSLIVDKSDPVKDTYSLVLATPLDEISSKTRIVLNVAPPAGQA